VEQTATQAITPHSELRIPHSMTSSWSSLECSPPCQGGDHGFKSRRGRLTARYANWQSGEPQTFVTAGSTPACATQWVVLFTAACRAVVAKQVRWMTRGSIPSRPTEASTNGPFVYRQDSGPSSRQGGFDSRTGHYDQVVKLANTRLSDSRATWLGSSTLPLVTCLTQASQRSAGPHKPRLSGATPEPATDRVRKQAKRRGREPRDFVSSTLTPVTVEKRSRGPTVKTVAAATKRWFDSGTDRRLVRDHLARGL